MTLPFSAPEPFVSGVSWIWPRAANGIWSAPTPRGENPFRVAYFRRTFEAPAGATLTVHATADSRYVLWCNGERVGRGPAKGDVRHHFYDTYDVTPHLRAGKNVIAAQVLSYSSAVSFPPEASTPTSIMYFAHVFALSGVLRASDGSDIETLHSDDRWLALHDDAYVYRNRPGWNTFLGMFEDVHGDRYPWGWRDVDYDESAWQPAHAFCDVYPGGGRVEAELPYRLMERMIPPLEETPCRFDGVARPENTSREDWSALIRDGAPLTIPANSTASVTLWCDALTTAFPTIETSGGAGAEVSLTYSEGLFYEATDADRGPLSPRHAPEDGTVLGYWDTFYPGGGEEAYEPLHWRTFRYVGVRIATGDEPLTISRADYRFTAYPFTAISAFESSDENHAAMWEMCWRTARLCAHETYEDCPYYEQLQYAGDTQVQCLLSYYMTGDARLAKQAIRHFDWSRDFEGLTRSRYPSQCHQDIPTYALLWMVMVRDYCWHTGDLDEAKAMLPGMLTTLGWFERRENADGLLEAIPYWQFIDWVAEWNERRGVPPGAEGGVSAAVNFQYAWALRCVAEIADAAGEGVTAGALRSRADCIVATLDGSYWLPAEGVYRDHLGGNELSEATNALAILAGSPRGLVIAERLGRDGKLAAATLYGRFYVFRALDAAGAYEHADALLDHWYDMMETDLTTFAETPLPSRSYCHAWSAAPLYEFLSQILGVKPAAPAWEKIVVRPHVWHLDWAKGSVPTPHGPVAVSWRIEDDTFSIDVATPPHVPVEIVLPDGSSHEAVGAASLSCSLP